MMSERKLSRHEKMYRRVFKELIAANEDKTLEEQILLTYTYLHDKKLRRGLYSLHTKMGAHQNYIAWKLHSFGLPPAETYFTVKRFTTVYQWAQADTIIGLVRENLALALVSKDVGIRQLAELVVANLNIKEAHKAFRRIVVESRRNT